MAQSPQRPYVPHRTPTRGQPAISAADFALARPFVPGSEQVQSAAFEPVGEMATASEPTLASIEAFIATPSPVAAPTSDIEEGEEFEDAEDLPPLEHFLDPLPPISDYSAEEPDRGGGEYTARETDWVETDWQRYDWQSIAALGDTEKAQAEASNAWASTDWEVPTVRRSERAQNPADAIATALDQIAERLRKGDLSLPGSGGTADPATIAATLAALLGVRR